jgi:hypothetical protein
MRRENAALAAFSDHALALSDGTASVRHVAAFPASFGCELMILREATLFVGDAAAALASNLALFFAIH